MKLAMTLLVKNEIDLVRTHIDFHLPQLDILIVMDNCSTDGTYEYLMSLKDDRVIVLTQAAQNYAQKTWVSRMVNTAIRLNADWIINADADEFFIGDLRGFIERAHNAGYNQIYPKGSNFYVTEKDAASEPNPVKRMLYRDPLSVKYEHDKVIHSRVGFSSVSQGNHWVFLYPLVQPQVLHTNEIRLFHYPVRSWEQFLSKYADANPTKIDNMGHIWKQRYSIYKAQGEEGLKRVFKQDYVLTEDQIKSKNLDRDTLLADKVKS